MKKPTTPTEASAIQRIARGAIQTFGSTYPARLINFAVILLLYQILVPEDFGAIATAYSILALVIAFRDLGLHYALLHDHDNVHELAPTHFVLSVSLGSISTLLALCLAVYSEQIFELTRTFNTYLGITDTYAQQNYPKVAIALGILGAFDLFRTAALTAETQLQRDLEFGRLAFAHAAGTILAALVGLALAYLGYGKWALILGFFPYSVTYILVYCIVVWLRHPPPIDQLHNFNPQAARRMIRYGIWFWIGGIPKIFVQHYDKLIISLFFTLSLRGIYDAAHSFAQIPSGAITMVIVRITVTVYARYQNNRDQLSAAYRRTSRLILRTTVPISLVLALEANRWIHIFKPDWAPAAPLLQWLIILLSLPPPARRCTRPILQRRQPQKRCKIRLDSSPHPPHPRPLSRPSHGCNRHCHKHERHRHCRPHPITHPRSHICRFPHRQNIRPPTHRRRHWHGHALCLCRMAQHIANFNGRPRWQRDLYPELQHRLAPR